jgi:hypothetical protein
MNEDGEKINKVAENVDRLITMDLKPSPIHQLYEAAREYHGKSPTLFAGEKLVESVGPGDFIILITGALVSPFGTGETDGPLGTAGLARALCLCMNARPIILTMASMVDMVRATVRAAGLNYLEVGQMKGVEDYMRGFVGIDSFPLDDAKAIQQSASLMETFNPKAVVSIEVTGPNRKGVYHNYGRDFSPYIFKAGRLFEESRRRGVLTIGVGDRGNEIGFGAPPLHEAARKTHPYGEKCRCPCGEGAADITKVDATVVAMVSNWGAYGIEAILSALLRNQDAMHDGTVESRMLHACSMEGGVDGRNQTPDYLVDSLPEIIHVGLVEMMRTILAASRIDFTSPMVYEPYGKGKY